MNTTLVIRNEQKRTSRRHDGKAAAPDRLQKLHATDATDATVLIPESVYWAIAERIIESAIVESTSRYYETREFTLVDEVIETDDADDRFAITVNASGVLHYRVSYDPWGKGYDFDSLGCFWADLRTVDEDGQDRINDFDVAELERYITRKY